MPYHRFRVLVDWSGNGQFNVNATSRENVTSDVISGIRAAAGINYGQVFPQAKAGRASFILRNDHSRYSGYNDSNDLGSGLQRGIVIQIWCADNTTFGAGGAWLPIWGGVVDYIQYGTSPSGLDTAELFCIGNLAAMQDANVDISLGESSIATIGNRIARNVWPSTRISETANATFRYIMPSGNPQSRYYLETSNSPTFGQYVYEGRALRAIRGIAQDTGSRLFEGAEGAVRLYSEAAQTSLAAGNARFTLRHTSTGTNASTFHVTEAKPELAQQDVINSVTVTYPHTETMAYTTYNAYGDDANQISWWYEPTRDPVAGVDGWYRERHTRDDDGFRISGNRIQFTQAGRTGRLQTRTSRILDNPLDNETREGARIVSFDRWTVQGLTITAKILGSDRWGIGDIVDAPRRPIFVVPDGTEITPGTTVTVTAAQNESPVDWATESALGTEPTTTVDLLMTRVSLFYYNLLITIRDVHPNVINLRTLNNRSPRNGGWDLFGPRVRLDGWTVSYPSEIRTLTITDSTSISSYGTKSYAPSVSFLTSEDEARAFAQAIIDRTARPTTRYRVTYILDQKNRLTDIPQVSDIVNLEYRGTTRKCWVDSVRHNITKRNHRCEMLLTPT